MHLGYQPDRVVLSLPGSGTTEIALGPVDEWIWGGGLAATRPLAGPFDAGVEVDYRVFSLETAHRDGAAIELGRESFGEWGARLSIAWRSRRS